MTAEEWKAVRGFGAYEASTMGSIRCALTKTVLGVRLCAAGYVFVYARDSAGNPARKTVHRLVASAFMDDLDEKMPVGHVNGVRTDNRVENLRGAPRVGLEVNTRCYNHIPVEQLDGDGRVVARHDTPESAARMLGLKGHGSIIASLQGRGHTAAGFRWRAAEVVPDVDERWEVVKLAGFSVYEASSVGRVRHALTKRVLTLGVHRQGYTSVGIQRDDGTSTHRLVHRLVASAFLDDWDETLMVGHINRVRDDNRVTNLRMAMARADRPTKDWGYSVARGDMTTKEWKPVRGFGAYEASTMGSIRCALTRTVLVVRLHSAGYAFVCVRDDAGIRARKMVHRLVASAFMDDVDVKMPVVHVNGVRTDNRVANLRVVPRVGLAVNTRCYSYIPVEQLDEDGRVVARYDTPESAATAVGLKGPGSIINTLQGRGHTAAGFRWRAAEETPDVNELWEPVKLRGFSGYEASSVGRVRHALTKRVLTLGVHGQGYPIVKIRRDDGTSANRLVHRLVASAFLDDWDETLTVDHVNRVRDDNRVVNLRMATHAEQQRNKGVPTTSGRRLVVPVEQLDEAGRVVGRYDSPKQAAAAMGLKWAESVIAVLKGRCHTAGGFRWRAAPPDADLPGEVWKEVGARLHISSEGRVKYLLRTGWSAAKTGADVLTDGRYPRISARGRHTMLHVVVARTFLPVPDDPAKTQVNHRDGDPTNAAAWNLEWMTPSENMQHAVSTGLVKTKKPRHT